MINLTDISYGFLTDYVHIAFLAGVIIGYLYFRRNRVSVGGTLAVGYLASSLYAPLNVLATIAAAFIAYLAIRFVVLKIFLPRPRQIFAIGLAVGVVLNAIWLGASQFLIPGLKNPGTLQLVGVIVPGMLCNSLVKQGVRKTVVPLTIMVPASAAIGLIISSLWALFPYHPLHAVYAPQGTDSDLTTFSLSAVSVLLAVIIQESTIRSLKLRTAGYVTAGVVASALFHLPVLIVILTVSALLAVFWIPYSQRIPLFGKDRFFILLMLSFTISIATEFAAFKIFGTRFDGPQNIVYTVLPAIIINDLTQYGVKRTAAGFGLSFAGCAALATTIAVAG